MKTLVSSFMRCNPPHQGHFLLIEKIKELSTINNAIPVVFLSHTVDKKNPLPYNIKSELMNKWSDGIVKIDLENKIKQPMNILHYAHSEGYEKVIIVCGEDRYTEYRSRIDLFLNSRDYFNFQSVEVVCRGSRGFGEVESMSSTKMREFIKQKDYESFRMCLPLQCTNDEAKMLLEKLTL